jgi:CubicO group peptidase (beta-lactamase class C family)
MKSSLLCPLFLFLLCVCVKGQDDNKEFPSQAQVNQLMDSAMQASDLPALVAIAVNQKGQKLTYTYGKAIWQENEPVTPQHIFRIYSMTKLVTSIAAMQLVERGLIGLDDDLAVLLPEMAKIPILSNGQLAEAKNSITLRHLLSHTSGFGYTSTSETLAKFDKTNWKYRDLPRVFESGTQFLYGTSTDWVGRLVEKLSNLSLEEYFSKHITAPLQMNRTFFNVPDSLKTLIVSCGNRGADGKQPLKELPDRIPKNPVKEYGGGGGLYSSPDDYTKLLQCLLNGGSVGKFRLLKKKTIQAMTQNHIGDITIDVSNAYFVPSACCDFRGLILKSSKWGLAWQIDTEEKPYRRKAGTVLWGGLMNTYFYIDYQSGIAVSIYSQHLPFNHPATIRLLDRFSEIVYMGK